MPEIMNVPRINALSTAVPKFKLNQPEVAHAAGILFKDNYINFKRLFPVFKNSGIETRYSCVPLEWYLQPHSFAERNDLYVENAVLLLEEAASACLMRSGLNVQDIDGLVVVSTTGVATPSLDALLIEKMRLRPNVRRLPIFGLGCVGGVSGLARAASMVRAEPSLNILYLVVELCGLTFQKNDISKSNIVATALFGDGAAGAIISSQGTGPAITCWGEHTWPDSLNVMGWKVSDTGLNVIFSRDIPSLVRSQLRDAVNNFLHCNELSLDDINAFIMHPGGAKILEALEETFGIPDGSLKHARTVLQKYGNMSAATVMFVLKSVWHQTSGKSLMCALGPGFTAGFVILES